MSFLTNPDFKDLLTALDDAKAQYLVDIVWFGRAPNRVDFLQRLPGVTFESALWRAARTDAFGLPVPVISIEDLIANKRAVGREQDLQDVRALERAQERER